jgi:carbonic anhydrase
LTFSRRSFIRLSTLGCACCLAANRTSAGATEAHPYWTYEGNTGPDHWGELSADFKTCHLGSQQTPIDLTSGKNGDAGALKFAYRPLPLTIVNNGHTIQVNAEPGSSCLIGDTNYDLLQFHFHHPSEHRLNGKAFEMECHFVHKAASGALAVAGVFFVPGKQNDTLKPIFDQMPKRGGETVKAGVSINPVELMPTSGGYFRYQGSLTTPPCSEGLTWTVFKKPVEVSEAQIRQFAALFTNNARPVQPINGRSVIEMF